MNKATGFPTVQIYIHVAKGVFASEARSPQRDCNIRVECERGDAVKHVVHGSVDAAAIQDNDLQLEGRENF